MKIQSHGKTVAEIEEIKNEQASGVVRKIKANIDPSIEINECDKHLVHVLLESRTFDAKTGQKLSKPFVTCFYKEDFLAMSNTVEKAGNKLSKRKGLSHYDVIKVVHDPSKGTGSEISAKIMKAEEDLDTDKSNVSFETIEEYKQHLASLDDETLMTLATEVTGGDFSGKEKSEIIDAIATAKLANNL